MSRMDYLALEEVAWLLAETFIYLVGAPHPPRLSILNRITVQPYGTWFVTGAILAPPKLTVQTVRRCLHEHVCSPFFKWTVGLSWTREQNWGKSSYVYSQDATTVFFSLVPRLLWMPLPFPKWEHRNSFSQVRCCLHVSHIHKYATAGHGRAQLRRFHHFHLASELKALRRLHLHLCL